MFDARQWVTEVTAEFPDRAPEDRFYRTANGYLVKAKGFRVPPEDHAGKAHGVIFKMEFSGSICGEDGKALIRPDGELAKYDLGQTKHAKAEGDSDEIAEIADAYLTCVSQTVRAHRVWNLAHGYAEGLPPLVTRDDYRRRKAAEAAEAAKGEHDDAAV